VERVEEKNEKRCADRIRYEKVRGDKREIKKSDEGTIE
jgi:hypothetical protein